ncbi:protein FecR [Nitrosomonas stercoris]|uniref:Protein FecR n=1 Tax=Nitrosomonas stercoris TaxID=1444684 RepID=A0A4Y1YMU2_9PROT|nr:protein FecR [Nitrosomonas stercoris]
MTRTPPVEQENLLQTTPLPEDIIEAAINWSIKLDYNDPTPETRQSFEQWLHADPLHKLAWQRVHSLDDFRNDCKNLPSRLAFDTLQEVDSKRQSRKQNRRNAIKLLSLASITFVTGWGVREHTPWQRLLADASTATGEQRAWHLADGTVVMLNTDSAVSFDLTDAQRLIVLQRGEVHITTGSDREIAAQTGRKRPFRVRTPFGELQALGTRFVVRLNEQHARISVQEGAVELHPAAGGLSAIVQAGESRRLTGSSILPAADRHFEEDSWVSGIIAGKNIRLADLVAELSRYRPGYITCDERVADLPISGIFHVKDTDKALRFLAQTQPISVTYRTRFWVLVGPKNL